MEQTNKNGREESTSVVIIGGGLTGLAAAAQLDMSGVPFVLLEKAPRVGGQIQTRHRKGYTYEVGPNTGSVSTPEVVELFDYAAPIARLEEANPAAERRWIWKGDRFHELPSGLMSGLKTPLFSWKDKLGIPLEPTRKKGTDPNETVGALAERRLGKSIVDYAVDPFIGGVYAGDPYQFITRFALPKLYRLEQDYGSFIGGSVRKAAEKKSERDKLATKKVFSAEGGLENLVQGVYRRAKEKGQFVLEAQDIQLTENPDKTWLVTYRNNDGQKHSITAKYVVTTVRGDQLVPMLPDVFVDQTSSLARFPYAPMIEVVVGFDNLVGVDRNAFGGLVPSREKRKVLGILFPSSCFKGRVPQKNGALFTLFMGGMRDRELFIGKSLDEIKAEGLEELYTMMDIPKEVEPSLVDAVAYSHAIPQYDTTYEQHLNTMTMIMEEHPTLVIAGGMRDGIGMAKRITQGMNVAKEIAQKL